MMNLRLTARNEEYGPIPKLLHWVTVALVAVAWILGTFGDELSKGGARDAGLLSHIWIGLAVLVIAAIRIPLRIANPPPRAASTEFARWLIEWTDPAARIMHYVLYALLLAVPIVGIVVQFAQGHPLSLFGPAEIPSPWVADKAFAHSVKDVHEVLANLLVILAVFHMTAALVHHIVFGDNTLRRMLPHMRKQM
jgi:cytochrome b561